MLANQLNVADDFVHPETPVWATAFQEQFAVFNEKLDALIAKTVVIESTFTTNQQVLQTTQEALLATQRQLAEATARIAELENPTFSVQPTSDPPAVREHALQEATVEPVTYGTEHSKYASLPPTTKAITATSASYAVKLKAPRPNQFARRNIDSNVRSFAPPSATQGFQYIYVPTNKKCPLKEMRYRLQRLGLGRGCIVHVLLYWRYITHTNHSNTMFQDMILYYK